MTPNFQASTQKRTGVVSHFVYITTTKKNTTIYVGVTNDLLRRMEEHSEGKSSSFTSRYNVKKLIYFEEFDTAEEAIAREKQLKRWHREWKLNLVQAANPDLRDLSEDFGFGLLSDSPSP